MFHARSNAPIKLHILAYIYIYICIYMHMCIYIYIYMTLSLLSFITFNYHFWQVFYTASRVCSELMYSSPCWSTNTGVTIREHHLILQQCFTSCLPWMDCEIGGKWPYICCSVRCCFQDFFKTAHSILVQFPTSFFSIHFISVQRVIPYSSSETATDWKKSHFILSEKLDFHNLSKSVHIYIYIYIYK